MSLVYIVGNVVKDVYLQLDERQGSFEKDENGNWKPAAEEVKLPDNVAVEIAYIDTSYQRNPYEENNSAFLDQCLAWQSLGGAGISFFMYNMNYLSIFYYYDSFNFFTTDIFRFINEMKPTHVISDTMGQGTSLITWIALKFYVESKMYWNTSLDVQELIEKYMVGVYKDVAPQMMKIFNETRIYSISMLERFGLNGMGATVQKEVEKKETKTKKEVNVKKEEPPKKEKNIYENRNRL